MITEVVDAPSDQGKTFTITEVHELPTPPDTSLLITQDDTPVDNIYVEKTQRLLTEPLYSSWVPPGQRPFLALANVGLFFVPKNPGLVPDVMLSLDVPLVEDRREKDNRSYFTWVIGKVPDVVIEIVSDRRGGEDSDKMRAYNQQHIPFYVIFDPLEHLDCGVLRAFVHSGRQYKAIDPSLFADVGLGLKLWQGVYENDTALWLRWCDADGRIIPTGRERADDEAKRAEVEAKRAQVEAKRAEVEAKRAQDAEQRIADAEEKNQRLAERLRQLGETVE